MRRVVYVSESRLGLTSQAQATAQIIAASQVRNDWLMVTGALLFTGTHFAQILEGPRESVDQLMSSLHRDVRHANIKIVDRQRITERKFGDWQMVYQGPSQFVSRHVARLLDSTSQSEQQRMVARLIELAYEFASTPDQ